MHIINDLLNNIILVVEWNDSPKQDWDIMILDTRLRCVNITPFGNPVVPLENGRSAILSQVAFVLTGDNDLPRVMRSWKILREKFFFLFLFNIIVYNI